MSNFKCSHTTEELVDLFDRDMNSLFSYLRPSYGQVTTTSDDGTITTMFDLPGVKPEDVSIAACGETLTISYKSREGKLLTKEYRVHPKYDGTTARAKLSLGVLEITVPKKSGSAPTNIPVIAK